MDLRLRVDRALLTLFEPACAACNGPLCERRRGPVCGVCWAAVRRLSPPWCARCGDPLGTWQASTSQACTTCRTHPPHFDAARAAGMYTGALRHIIHALKYGRQPFLAAHLAALMREVATDWLDTGVVVPVPLHPWRSLRRGFNQADTLARGLGAPVWRPLRRLRLARPQAGLVASQRHENVAGVYGMRRWVRRQVPGTVVLVDDVMTTGATADACARVLKRAGVNQVFVLTAARTVSERRI